MTKDQDYLKMALDSGARPTIDNSPTQVWFSMSALERFAQLVRNSALEEAKQAAQPDDAYQDEWFKAKADACRRINLLKEQG